MKSSSLISLGQICDDDCTIVMNSNNLYATKTKHVRIQVKEHDKIMRGVRNHSDGLYDIPIFKEKIDENYVLPHNKYILPTTKKEKSSTIVPIIHKPIRNTPKTKQTVANIQMK